MTLGLPERIEAKISSEPNSGCWLWTGALDGGGYARLNVKGENCLAHRVIFTLITCVEIPKNLEIDHLCRIRCCVNPQHFELVSKKINILRGVGPTAKNAVKTHCLNAHELLPANTYISKSGGRYCRICKRLRTSTPEARAQRIATSELYKPRRNALLRAQRAARKNV